VKRIFGRKGNDATGKMKENERRDTSLFVHMKMSYWVMGY
jgi:hypothetical protein